MRFPGPSGEFWKAENSLAFILFLNNLPFARNRNTALVLHPAHEPVGTSSIIDSPNDFPPQRKIVAAGWLFPKRPPLQEARAAARHSNVGKSMLFRPDFQVSYSLLLPPSLSASACIPV
jgi:hypothetical protein